MKKLFSLLLALLLMLGCASAETLREVAQEYSFTLSEGEELYFENLIFDGTVTIGGDNATAMFVNCAFIGDVVLTADEATRVLLIGCSMTGRCVFENAVDNTTIDWIFPKILTDTPVEAVCENCVGALITMGDFEVIFNGQPYSMEDSLFSDPEAGLVPYAGQPASICCVAHWYENGEPMMLVISEQDS